MIKLEGPPEIVLEQGMQYGLCAGAGSTGSGASTVCDRGATAQHPTEGDLSRIITACGKPVASFGLFNCDLDTNTPGIYTIDFQVNNCSRGDSRLALTRKRTGFAQFPEISCKQINFPTKTPFLSRCPL